MGVSTFYTSFNQKFYNQFLNEKFEGFPETSFEERIGQQFSSSQMGSILGRLESTLHAELVQRYLYDFVAMKYCPVTNNQQEIEVIKRCAHTFCFISDLESLSYYTTR